jgi:hypothetical protein
MPRSGRGGGGGAGGGGAGGGGGGGPPPRGGAERGWRVRVRAVAAAGVLGGGGDGRSCVLPAACGLCVRRAAAVGVGGREGRGG